jgi:hypothetical protein
MSSDAGATSSPIEIAVRGGSVAVAGALVVDVEVVAVVVVAVVSGVVIGVVGGPAPE